MDLEKLICEEVTKQVNSEKFREQIKTGVENMLISSLNNFLGWSSPVKREIDEQLRKVMAESLGNIDIKGYLPKLDYVLTTIIRESSIGHYKRLTDNFKELLLTKDVPKQINLSEIFEKYKECCSIYVDTYNLEIDYDDEPTYMDLTCNFETEECKKPYSLNKEYIVKFNCVEDSELNKEYKLVYVYGTGYKLPFLALNIKSLRYLNSFEVFMLMLSERGTEIIIDKYEDEDDAVEVYDRPEATYE